MITEEFEGMLYTSDKDNPFCVSERNDGSQLSIQVLTTNTYNGNLTKELKLRDSYSKENIKFNQWELVSIIIYYNWYDSCCAHIVVKSPDSSNIKLNSSNFISDVTVRPRNTNFCVTAGIRILESIRTMEKIRSFNSLSELKEAGYKYEVI